MRNFFHSFIIFISFIFFIPLHAHSQDAEKGYMFRVSLKNKGKTPYSLDKPEQFLSQKAIERRFKQGYRVDSTDIPVNQDYISAIKLTGGEIKAVSKWLNTVTVYFPDSSMIESVHQLPFVDSVRWVWVGVLSKKDKLKSENENNADNSKFQADASYYGAAYDQIHLHEGELLHESGFKGEGMTIALLDATFTSVDKIDFFNQAQILESKNFTHQYTLDVSLDVEHGTKVLSCMFANKPGEMVGTAPNANYYLLQTEVINEEYLVEEDYWVAGIEYADSLGVDVVNSSLGYTQFTEASMDYQHAQLDGKTALISKAASMASKKGMLLFISAGNEREADWQKIGFPADAEGIITVGGVDSNKEISYFSSVGFSADGRVKPDLMSRGTAATIFHPIPQNPSFANGTSFASPILAGLGACLWQALPDFSNLEIIYLLKKSADHYQHPDSLYGYGIPNVNKAYISAKTPLGINSIDRRPAIFCFDSSGNFLYLNLSIDECASSKLQIFSVLGNQLINKSSLKGPIDISYLRKGVYIASVDVNGKRYVRKFIKL